MNPGDIRGVCHFTQWNAYTRRLIWPSLVRKWLVIKFGSAPNLYLKQCLFIINMTFNKYWIQIQQSSYTITNSNMSSAEWWQFCLRLDNSNCIAFWINCCVWRVHVTNENFCRFPEAADKEIECMIEALHMANIWCQRITHANAFWISISMSGICLKSMIILSFTVLLIFRINYLYPAGVCHDDVVTGRHFQHYWPFVHGLQQAYEDFPPKGPLMWNFRSLFC